MFEVGDVIIPESVIEEINTNEIWSAIRRYVDCDWGDISDEDRRDNNKAIKYNERILAKYVSKNKKEFYIYTKPDRTSTNVSLEK